MEKDTIVLTRSLLASILQITEELNKLCGYYQPNYSDAIIGYSDKNKSISSPRKTKGYSLAKVKNKENGFLYYVRYYEKGKMIPSRWSTHTNDIKEAELYAEKNRETILAKYFQTKDDGMYSILKKYYLENSQYLEIEKLRGRELSPKSRRMYYNFIKNVFIPFLRKQNIKGFEEITPPVINTMQNYLLKKGNRPQTINRYTSGIQAVFNYLVMHGKVKENIFTNSVRLRVSRKNLQTRDCYEIEDLKGVFKEPWENSLSYILCLLIYTTGLRNSEIEKIKLQDFVSLENINFLSIPKSKTQNGIRFVPVHVFVYQQLMNFYNESDRKGEYLFSKHGRRISSDLYRTANADMKKALDQSEEKTKNISFYSGRHFWKTLMSSEDLGDIEEYFMGHKVSRDVKKLYNHLDKRGQKKLVQKAREVFSILDQYIL